MVEDRVVSRPLSIRVALGFVSALFGVPITVLAAAAMESRVALITGSLVTAVLMIRGFRVAMCADRSEIIVRNHFRTYRVKWENLSHVGIGVTTSIAALFPAVMFGERGGRRVVAAQATTSGGREQRRVIRELAKLRPDLQIQFSE